MVTLLILHQAFELVSTSLSELTDRGVSSSLLDVAKFAIEEEITSSAPKARLRVRDIKGIRRGANIFIEASLDLDESSTLSVQESVRLGDAVLRKARGTKKEIKDISLRFVTISR
jgi:divalent metal cation (Fe/Co/Zn/Cd) transporter